VDVLAVQPDGKVLLGGDFFQINGQSRNHMARLNADGSLDPNFAAVAVGFALTPALQLDGKVLMTGEFAQSNGEWSDRITRLKANPR
jgi:Domain of unknown function (DUF5122) beta-propeller